jgi:hypothetical protein
MFKKSFKLQANNLLKSKDKRKLRDAVLKSFPRIKESDLDSILPLKEEISFHKISGTHTLLYVCLGNPVFFDVDGKGDLFPTGMWKFICLK